MFACFPSVGLSCAIPPDPEGGRYFSEATEGVGVKQLADWMGVVPSQITRWRQSGNVPDSRLRRLPPDILRRYRELQAVRDGVCVITARTMDNAIGLVNAALTAVGWRPVMVRASLAPTVDGALVGRGKVA